MAELSIPPHIRDLILDHAPARGSGAGYDHYTYRDEMREALEAWAGHIEAARGGRRCEGAEMTRQEADR
jgi:hypothetical protein